MNKLKQLPFLRIGLFCLPIAMILAPAAGESADYVCEDPQALTFHAAETVAGTMIAGLNPLDELTVVIDQTENDLADSVLRMALKGPGRAVNVLDQWASRRQPVEVTYRQGMALSEVVFRFPRAGSETWVFEIDRHGCADRVPARTEVPADRFFSLRAFAWNRVAAYRESLESMLDTSMDYELISTATRDPFTCVAGGPGASACSIDFGGIGGIGFGGCSADCSDMPGYHACCGPGFLGNCSCRYDGTTGIPPGTGTPPDDGDGGGDSGGGPIGGGGSPGDGGDDDDDDDDDGDVDPTSH